MTRGLHPAERDVHERFTAWLLRGAGDEPARDLALHGAYCPECRTHMAALDLLTLVDPGRASMPPSRRGAAHMARARFGSRPAWVAAASLVIVAVGGWALGFGRPPSAQGSPAPAQQVLGGFGGGEVTSSTPVASESPEEPAAETASDAMPEPTTTGSVTPAAPPVASGNPRSAAPTVTQPPEPSRPPRPTSSPTATPSPAPTPTPTPDDCEDGIDNDGDTLIDLLDPGCLLDGNEASAG